jgi:DNA-binding transcriptional MocR family regulator
MWFWGFEPLCCQYDFFQQSGAIIKTIPIDEQGLDVDYIKTRFIKGQFLCVYICANRDYPQLFH